MRFRSFQLLPAPHLTGESLQSVELPGVGAVAYRSHRQGAGRALVLVPGLDLTSGAHAMRPLFAAFGERPVYALDWPGFGASQRSQPITAPLCARALLDFIRAAIAPYEQPVDVIALARGSEVAALAAISEPGLIRSLSLLSPTGFGSPRPSPKLAQLVREVRRSPRLARLAFWAMTSTPAVMFSLSRSFQGRVDRSLAAEAHSAARQPGAEQAALSLLEETLAARGNPTTLYEALRLPTFVLYDRDPNATFELLPAVTRGNAFVRSLRIGGTRGLPHFEQLPSVEAALRDYYRALDVAERFGDWESAVETVPSFERGEFAA